MPEAVNLDVAVVGGGVSGMSTAFWLSRQAPGSRVAVFESEGAAGGKVRGQVEAGTVFDWGPASFRSGTPALLELLAVLGLQGEVRYAAPEARRRYLYLGGRLQPLPGSPPTLLASRLLSPAGKLRALAEPWVRRSAGEETVHGFVARRFGPEVAEHLADALVAGVSAGTATEVSVDALFPRWRELEQAHGSVVAGMLRAARSARAGERAGQPSAPSSQFTLAGGTQRLSAALAAALGERLVTGAAVRRLRRTDGAFLLELADGRSVVASRVVLATPAPVSAALLGELAPGAARRLAAVRYAGVVVHALAFDAAAVPRPLDGFGYLVARGERVRSLGAVWTSTLFPDQAPTGTVQVRVLSGGRRDPTFLELDDAAALEAVRQGLRLTLGVTAPPRAVWAHRAPAAIPQYELGHAARMAEAQAELDTLGGLALAGDVVAGVAVPACLAHARELATRLASSLPARAPAATHSGDTR